MSDVQFLAPVAAQPTAEGPPPKRSRLSLPRKAEPTSFAFAPAAADAPLQTTLPSNAIAIAAADAPQQTTLPSSKPNRKSTAKPNRKSKSNSNASAVSSSSSSAGASAPTLPPATSSASTGAKPAVCT